MRITTDSRHIATWYFAWVLGLGLAVGFSILNGTWHEVHLPKWGDGAGRN
ncbi:cytochrome bd-I oxidase subunit CydX [Sphingobium indicum]